MFYLWSTGLQTLIRVVGLCLLFQVMLPLSVFAEEKIQTAVTVVREFCITGGKSVEINANGRGGFVLKRPLETGVSASVEFRRSEISGLAAALKFEGENASEQATDMRACTAPFIDRLLNAILGESTADEGSKWVLIQSETTTLTTGNHHCSSNCRGEPTRTGYEIELVAPAREDGGRRLLRNPKLSCVSGPCHGWNSITLHPYVDASGAKAKASFDVWSKPTSWKLEAEYYEWK